MTMPFDHSKIQIDQFADIRILRYNIKSFDQLTLRQKKLVYYLSEAALCGRDILFDQHFRYNLPVRKVLETIWENRHQVKTSPEQLPELEVYLKRLWFSSGIHHHYSTAKIKPGFTETAFVQWFNECGCLTLFKDVPAKNAEKLTCEVIFSYSKHSRRTPQNSNDDLITQSCNNFYKNINQVEAEAYYERLKSTITDDCPPSFGLNSRLVSNNNTITEEVWHLNGKYGKAINQIVFWLNKAKEVAENHAQAKSIDLLVDFYTTGNLATFDQYNINWLADQSSQIDFVNGFIEVYGDPLGLKGSWEAMVNVTDAVETDKIKTLSDNAQWFEDRSPIDPQYRKEKVTGVSMKIIEAITLGGDCYPASPLGINLPNADWIREKHGSKSVSLSNISESHHLASANSGVIEEFAATQTEIDLHKQYGSEADHLHTHLHECLGHGSGRLKQGVTTDMLKSYASVIEEARADLFALYFMADAKILELGLSPHPDLAKTHYNSYIRNGLMVQLTRIELGAKLEQAHMRNRQLIAKWVYEKGIAQNIIKKTYRSGKTYFEITDYDVLRTLFGELLKEVQRIKSEGDFEAAKQLVDNYGVEIEADLHAEILERFAKLKIAPFAGFVNPKLTPDVDNSGDIRDINIDYTEDYATQMQRYSKHYSYLVEEAIVEMTAELTTGN